MQNCIRELIKYRPTRALGKRTKTDDAERPTNELNSVSVKNRGVLDSLGSTARLSMYSKLYSVWFVLS